MRSTDELVQTLTTGISAEEGHENGYMEQLQQSRHTVSQASTLEEQALLKIKHLRKELAEKEPQAAKALADSQGSVAALEQKKLEISELEVKNNNRMLICVVSYYVDIATIECLGLESRDRRRFVEA